MAYSYYNPYQVQYANQMQMQQPVVPVQAQQQPQQNNNGLIWVQGETGAKSYLVAPNSTVLLMDSENQRFYLKSSDASGMPLPLRIFEYTEKAQNTPNNAPVSQTMDLSSYATKAELDTLRNEIDSILKDIPKQTIKTRKTEVNADG